jgi:hypothetical protein
VGNHKCGCNHKENGLEMELWNYAIKKVNAPKVTLDPLVYVELSGISFLVANCQKGTFTGEIDKAIFFTLMHTGYRSTDDLDLNIEE